MKQTRVELSERALSGSKSLLDRLEGQMEQFYSEPVEVETRISPAGSRKQAVRTKLELASVGGPTVEEALSRARPVSEGGAFTYVKDDATLPTGARDASPLYGLPFVVKDLIAVAGRPISACSLARKGAPAETHDAPIVAQLREAGAVFVGTTSLHEFAFGPTGVNAVCGTTANPHDPTRIAGGSSTGSAVAVAENSAWIALGTDTGGSVRIPAALCGVVGFKPKFETYPIRGVLPVSPTLDHVGLIAPTVADLGIVHTALGNPPLELIRPNRIGVLWDDIADCEPEVRDSLNNIVRRLELAGCELVDVDWPDREEAFAVSTVIMFSEAAAIHRAQMMGRPGQLGEDIRARLMVGLALPAAAYVAALRMRERLIDRVRSVLASLDGLLGPTVGIVAPKIAEASDSAISETLVAHTRLANVIGAPALTLPVKGKGLPVGLQLVGSSNDKVLGVGAWLESDLLS